jgi:hypothetical protein
MNVKLVDWQRIDSNNGLVEPWWTHPCLDVIKQWDLTKSKWLEFGAGLSTGWLRSKCAWVDSIEATYEWANRSEMYCIDNSLLNGRVNWMELADGDEQGKSKYFGLIPDTRYDIISVDGIFRDDCLQWAIDHFKGREGILIVDNLNQDYVWISERAMKVIEPYDHVTYVQPDHFNNEGKPWNTRIFHIPA